MNDFERCASAIETVAARWQDPDEPARSTAVEKTLKAPNRFTEESIAFAVNQQMHQLRPESLRQWIGGRRAAAPQVVGVIGAGNVPLADLQDFLAVVLTGHTFLGSVSSKSPVLLPAFVEAVRQIMPGMPASFAGTAELFSEAERIIAAGSNETRDELAARCDSSGIPRSRRLLRGNRYSVAIVDGREDATERGGLAEDILLHEGAGCLNVALLWGQTGVSPDPYLDAMMQFRQVFPAHPSTNDALRMPAAFLGATGQPHALGDGFLLSKGVPDVQMPGHIRWVDYESLDGVEKWLNAHQEEIQVVVASERIQHRISSPLPMVLPGEAQRPSIDWCPDRLDTVDFLTESLPGA